MTKVKVTERFKDKFKTPDTFYEVGQVVEFADETRVKNLVELGWVEEVKATYAEPVKVADAPKPRPRRQSKAPKPE